MNDGIFNRLLVQSRHDIVVTLPLCSNRSDVESSQFWFGYLRCFSFDLHVIRFCHYWIGIRIGMDCRVAMTSMINLGGRDKISDDTHVCHQVVCCPRCVCDFGPLWKSFACRFGRYLFRMLVVFGLGECVRRFVSLLNSGPHVSGLSRRHVSEHVSKNSEGRNTTCADAHVSRRFKPLIVRSCATKLASIQSRDHDRADHHSLRCLWRRVRAVSRVFFVLDVCMCGFPSRWLGGTDVC